MDKSTLSNYGWIVIITLVLSVMLAFATPFGTYVAKATANVIKYYKTVTGDTFSADYIEGQGKEWDKYLNDIKDPDDDHIYGIGKTKSEYVLAIFNEDYTQVNIVKNGSDSDGLMMDWNDASSPMCLHKDTLKTVTVEEDVKSIGNYAFNSCDKITTTVLNQQLEIIGNYSFQNCSELTSIEFPTTMNNIGKNAFESCTKLSGKIIIPKNVTVISERLFAYCPNIDEVYLHDTVTDIQTWAFFECKETKITSENDKNNTLYLPNLTNIGNTAFYWCDIKSIIIPKGMTKINPVVFHRTWLENVVFEGDISSIGMSSFIECNLQSITLPDTLTSIGDQAFSRSLDLKTINIPKNLSSIGQRAFNYCGGIEYYTIDPENQHFKLIDGVLYTADEKTLVSYPSAKTGSSYTVLPTVTNIYEGAFLYNEIIENITLPSGIKTIGRETFSYCDQIKSITIPDGVTSIGEKAFFHCIKLTDIYIPATVKSINADAFDECESEITIYGTAGSYAQTYANTNGYSFVEI